MSAIRLNQRPALKVQSGLQFATARKSPAFRLGVMAVSGFVAIILIQLVLGVLTSQGAYEMARLKAERHELTTSSDILAAQVDSLASNQNLANSAQSLGMIPNSSPVFLNLADDKLIGKPKAAYFDSSHQVSRNLVPNAAMTTKSRWDLSVKTASTNVVTAEVPATEVTLSTGDLPVSPTH